MAFLESPDPKIIAETLVAFANTEGGFIVVGLKANGEAAKQVPPVERLQAAVNAF